VIDIGLLEAPLHGTVAGHAFGRNICDKMGRESPKQNSPGFFRIRKLEKRTKQLLQEVGQRQLNTVMRFSETFGAS
jgi:hypothetical protein